MQRQWDYKSDVEFLVGTNMLQYIDAFLQLLRITLRKEIESFEKSRRNIWLCGYN